MRILSTERRLANQSVFLSGSVPQPERGFARVANAAFVIEQAVVGLARATFAEGGRIVFGAHPSFSPLVASVAAEYQPPSSVLGRRPVIIYQSRAFEEVLPNATWDMYRFGFADLIWTEAQAGEHYWRGDAATPKCPHSLHQMRMQMIREQDPVAMVILGGMEGVDEELKLFRDFRPNSPIYAARDTGGAAARLLSEQNPVAQLHPLEDEWIEAGGSEWLLEDAFDDPRETPVPPYGAMMQWLVGQLYSPLR